jgi:CRP/FNR family cyclic AMP-dependent transcriptional regulator
MRNRTIEERSSMLREVDLFSTCTKKELAQVSSLCSTTSATKGEILTRQGQYGDQFFVIIDGEATVWRNGRTIARLGKGSFFGEMALLEGNDRTATVVAETDVRLLVLSRPEFRSLTLVAPAVIQKIMTGLSARLRQADELIADDSAFARLQVL